MGPTNLYSSNKTSKMGLLAPALAMGGGILSSLIGSGQQRRADKRTFAHNKEMAKYAYSKDLEMWNRSNVYNTPQQQMERLKQGGLNPNLVYGTGTVTGNVSGQLPRYNAPTADFKKGPTPDFSGMLGQYHNIEQQKAQINLTNKQAEVAQQTAKNKFVDTALKGTGKQQKDQAIRHAEGLYPSQLQYAQERVRSQEQVTLSHKEEITRKKYINKLNKQGLHVTDHVFLRQLINKGVSWEGVQKAVKQFTEKYGKKDKYPILK